MTPICFTTTKDVSTKMEPDVPLLPLSKRESMLIIISFSTANLEAIFIIRKMRRFRKNRNKVRDANSTSPIM